MQDNAGLHHSFESNIFGSLAMQKVLKKIVWLGG